MALGTGATHFILLVVVQFKGGDAINDSNCARAVNPRRYALLPDVQVVLFELIQVFELTLKLSSDKEVLSLFMHPEHIVILPIELFKLDLVETERGKAPKIRM